MIRVTKDRSLIENFFVMKWRLGELTRYVKRGINWIGYNHGLEPDDWKTMPTIEQGVQESRIRDDKQSIPGMRFLPLVEMTVGFGRNCHGI
jgi:hypothetical protein